MVKLGDTIGYLKLSSRFAVGSLTDSGQLAFTTVNAAGGDRREE